MFIFYQNNCFNTLARPILEYGSIVWDPHFQTDIDALEKVQKRAARFITNNYQFQTGNTKDNMQKLGWEPLEERRAKIKVTSLFKARNNLMDIPLNHLTINTRISRGGQNYALPHSTVDSHLHSYYPSAAI